MRKTKIERGIGDVVYDRVGSADGHTTNAYLPTDRPLNERSFTKDWKCREETTSRKEIEMKKII